MVEGPDAAASGASDRCDLLVVGAGPAGTAAAFRGRELGLEVVVLDFDDILKRIRDYSKEKLILPSFGGGDTLRFPGGGELVSALCFGPIDKDDLCAAWKRLYREHRVEARIGWELTGLQRSGDGGWQAIAWDHREPGERRIEASAVALAIGRGVPRRFDVPGDTDGIAFRLEDPARYVGEPALVVGGGTSAAEAVLALSNAKVSAGDPSAVYWSYRGDRMPRISRALSGPFFEAYVGNGNIRYFPRSEPAAVVTGADRRDYLAVRIDRREMEARPAETVHLEFPKERVIACIGEDLPVKLLAGLGIELATGGPRARKRLAVTSWLETALENVFLAGDLLSPVYLEADDLEGDPAGFREVRHRGNVKAALRDGVLVAEAVRQRLDGARRIEVCLADAVAVEEEAEGARPVAGRSDPAAGLAADRAEAGVSAHLVRLLPTGVEAEEFPLREDAVTTIGRRGVDVAFPDDTLMSDAHASIAHGEEGFLLRDDGGANGVFYRLPAAEKVELAPGDLLRAGRQYLRVETGGETPTLVHFDAGGREAGRFRIADRPLVLGRAGDRPLDEGDGTLSRRHLAVEPGAGGRLLVKDLKSVNGTYLRVRAARPLVDGDLFRAGQQLFRLATSDGSAGEPHHQAPPRVAAAPAPSAPPPAAAGRVVFTGLDRSVEVEPGETVCEAAERAGLPITAECHAGICGSDPVRIVAGADRVVGEPDARERETLEELCELEPGPCRLACRLRVRGEIEVELL